jgi:hypothetical protein
MPLEFVNYYTRSLVRSEDHKLFVFGDNEQRRGRGGQAKACRGMPNAVGITTKRAPTMRAQAFYTDRDYVHWWTVNKADFQRLHDWLRSGGDVVWPWGGIGTGLAELPTRAPLIQEAISQQLQLFREAYGVVEKRKEVRP